MIKLEDLVIWNYDTSESTYEDLKFQSNRNNYMMNRVYNDVFSYDGFVREKAIKYIKIYLIKPILKLR